MAWRSTVQRTLVLWGLIATLLASACGDDRGSTRKGGAGMEGGASGSAGAAAGGLSGTAGNALGGTNAAGAGQASGGGGEDGGEGGDQRTGEGGDKAAGEGGGAGDDVGPPPSLPQCAGHLDRTVPTTMFEMARCLFEGEDAPQRELTSGIIEPKRVAVLRGRVLDEEGAPLAGVMVSVWNHPEFGHTLSRWDGHYDLAVNGGGQLTLRYELDGFLAARRRLATRWREFAMFPEVVLLQRATAATEVDLDGRGVNVQTLDARGLVTSVQAGDLSPITFEYDARGNLVAGRQGEREWMLEYDPGGYLAATENALGERSTFVRDAVGRPLEVARPDGEVLSASFDLNGNLTVLSPPGRPEHRFEYGLADALLGYIPPAADASRAFSYDYNEDDQLALVTFPGGGQVARTYDGAGRLSAFGADGELTTLSYDAGTGLLATLAGESETLTFSYTGDLVTGVTWSGVVSGSVSSTIDAFFRSTSERVGSDAIGYSYDDDGLLTAVGAARLTRDPESGSITQLELGQLTSTTEYNGLGEATRFATSFGSAEVYAIDLDYDALGRIDTRVETVQGVTQTASYEYDDDGRLVVARRDGVVRGTYAYDANGNRTSATDDTGSRTATHDGQDRLLTDGSAAFTYSPEGATLTRKVGSSTTTYRYDLLGALREVELPDSRRIEYVVDGAHRRIGKKINGTLERAYLYRNDLNIVAELDGAGALVSRFVYGSRPHVPDFMLKAGATYRFVTDERGSVRLLLDATTGAVAQRLDYDVWGNVTADTNPGFQPFGFAGGHYDRDTSLVRFGARDYDPSTGRWTAKDPLGFGGGQANLYAYVGNDPLNFVDPSGQYAWLAGAAVMGGADLALQLALNGGSFDCVDWGQVGISAAVGALGFGRVPGVARGGSRAQPYWPPNHGFAGTPMGTSLAPGSRIDRYGSELGTFASPAGTPFGARSLPSNAASAPLRRYEVLKPLPAQSGTAAPWFGQVGGGTQYEFPQSIESLVRQGYLGRLP